MNEGKRILDNKIRLPPIEHKDERSTMNRHSTRRQFLAQSAFGGGLLALPQFVSLVRANEVAVASTPKRLVVIHPHLSFYPHEFYPATTGTDFETPRLLRPLEGIRGNYTLFNGLDHPNMSGGHAVTSTLLTGENFNLLPVKRHGISLDQFIAGEVGVETRFDKMIVVLPGGGESTQVSFDANGTPFPDRIKSATDFYERLFVTDPQAQKQLRVEIESNRSILDGLRAEVSSFERRLNAGDRERLDHFLTAIRDLETRMAKQIKWSDIDKPAPPDGYAVSGDASAARDSHAAMGTMFDLAVLALQTDSTRVMTLAIPGGTPSMPGIEFSATYHQLSHHGKRDDKIKELLTIEDAHMKQIGRFIDKLVTTKDAHGQPLLDSTMVMISSGIGNAHSHSNQHLPVLVAGGGYKHRGYVDLRDKDIPLCNLFVDFAQRMGVDCEKFATSNGEFGELS